MKKHFYVWIVAAVLVLAGCGRGIPHNLLIKEPPSTFNVKSASVSKINVAFKDENEDAQKLETDTKEKGRAQLEAMLEKKNLKKSPANALIVMDVTVDWGNRALRHFVGFGAGAGKVLITISLKDRKSDSIIYQTQTAADLGGGANFGGDMSVVMDRALPASIEEFGSRLPQN